MAAGVRVDDRDAQRVIARMRLDSPFAVAWALTRIGQDVKAAQIGELQSIFDRPTRFTLNATYLRPATKTDLVAVVEFREGFGSVPAWRYLGPQVAGGARSHKAFEKRLIRAGVMLPSEYAVPGSGAPLDQHGNIKGSYLMRVLSQLGAAEQMSGYQANATKSSRSRLKRRRVGQFFAMRDRGGAAPGVYIRKSDRSIEPVLIFVSRASYRKRYPFYEIGERVTARVIGEHLAEAYRRYVAYRRAA